jgi:hypothetical protein
LLRWMGHCIFSLVWGSFLLHLLRCVVRACRWRCV